MAAGEAVDVPLFGLVGLADFEFDHLAVEDQQLEEFELLGDVLDVHQVVLLLPHYQLQALQRTVHLPHLPTHQPRVPLQLGQRVPDLVDPVLVPEAPALHEGVVLLEHLVQLHQLVNGASVGGLQLSEFELGAVGPAEQRLVLGGVVLVVPEDVVLGLAVVDDCEVGVLVVEDREVAVVLPAKLEHAAALEVGQGLAAVLAVAAQLLVGDHASYAALQAVLPHLRPLDLPDLA